MVVAVGYRARPGWIHLLAHEPVLLVHGDARQLAIRILAGDGFRGWGDNHLRGEFVKQLQKLGWILEKMPNRRIRSFDQLIDDLR